MTWIRCEVFAIKMHIHLSSVGVELNSKIVATLIEGSPQEVFARFKDSRDMTLLESMQVTQAAVSEPCWSYIACPSVATLQTQGGATTLFTTTAPVRQLHEWSDPFVALRETLNGLAIAGGSTAPRPNGLSFISGLVGFLGYDLARYVERLPVVAQTDTVLPDMHLQVCDHVLAYEHVTQRWFFCTTYLPGISDTLRAKVWQHSLEQAQNGTGHDTLSVQTFNVGPMYCKTPAQQYLEQVSKVLEFVEAGDILQANLSHRLEASFEGSAFGLYKQLTCANPAAFSAYVVGHRFAIASVSPERFLKVTERQVRARPIKGTRARGANKEQDESLRVALQASLKDRAENVMIVDLMRNDLGRVARLGSVQVSALFELEPHPSVWQMVSTITAHLRDDADMADLLRACWPPGSMTGAPKVRAMEIIDTIEPVRRGAYAGSIGYFDVSGDMDLSVIIRTAIVEQGRVMVQVGGAIVADSVPAAELEETYAKGRILFKILGWL